MLITVSWCRPRNAPPDGQACLRFGRFLGTRSPHPRQSGEVRLGPMRINVPPALNLQVSVSLRELHPASRTHVASSDLGSPVTFGFRTAIKTYLTASTEDCWRASVQRMSRRPRCHAAAHYCALQLPMERFSQRTMSRCLWRGSFSVRLAVRARPDAISVAQRGKAGQADTFRTRLDTREF